ncbi:conserved Plasmodium protein, unknown function [Plasmodium ovale wallikeri]|uniref:Uncharacterized protein n=1 Tax=Plasmodium ovale wallikeri TaxID=864142 RepID=A0A1A8ZM98_PLAOA|nr:conserved Plasmodium protein, unknown function [Plasmodium ovale wallikeri]SBT45418.1 conserved Plasmodium protein, unknown function [Plasmodium ovale wallikeri]
MVFYVISLILLLGLWEKGDCQFCGFKERNTIHLLPLNIGGWKNKQRRYKIYERGCKTSINLVKNNFAKLRKAIFSSSKKECTHVNNALLKRVISFNYPLFCYVISDYIGICKIRRNDGVCDKNVHIVTNWLEDKGHKTQSSKKEYFSHIKRKASFISNYAILKKEKRAVSTYKGSTIIADSALYGYGKCRSMRQSNFGKGRNRGKKKKASFLLNLCTDNYTLNEETNKSQMEICENGDTEGGYRDFPHFVVWNILKGSFIHNYTKDDAMKRLLKEIHFLFYKFTTCSYGEENSSHVECIDGSAVQEGEWDDKHFMRETKYVIYGKTKKKHIFFKSVFTNDVQDNYLSPFHNNKNEEILKIWLKPLNLVFIHLWMYKLVNTIFHNSLLMNRFTQNNFFIKYENDIQKRLFFHLQYFYLFFPVEQENEAHFTRSGCPPGNPETAIPACRILYSEDDQCNCICGSDKHITVHNNGNCFTQTNGQDAIKYRICSGGSSSRQDACTDERKNAHNIGHKLDQTNDTNNGKNNRMVIYIYRDNDENIEKMYDYLKRVYGDESVSLLCCKRYIHKDGTSSIILLSYEEFLKITLRCGSNFAHGNSDERKKYAQNELPKTSNLHAFISEMVVAPPSSSNGGGHENEEVYYKCKIFLDNFSLTYNYEGNYIEKNIYVHLFSVIRLHEGVTFYFLCNEHFNLTLFKNWIENIHKKCTIINLMRKKQNFVLHKKFILQFSDNEDAHTDGEHQKGRNVSNGLSFEEVSKGEEDIFLNSAQKKKKNIMNKEVAKKLLLFNKYRKEIIIKYLKEHNLYNINKLRKINKKIKRKLNIARRYLKKKKKISNLNILHYIDFIVNQKKGNVFLKKKIINPEYILREENLQIHDKIELLAKRVHITFEEGNLGKKRERKAKDDKLKLSCESHLDGENGRASFEGKNKWDNIILYKNISNDTWEKCEGSNFPEKRDEHTVMHETTCTSKKNVDFPFEKVKLGECARRYFYTKREGWKGQNCGAGNQRNDFEIYPCIYYIFNEEDFSKLSKALYETFNWLDEQLRQKWKYFLKKYEQVIQKSFNFKKYLRKGIFIINSKLGKIEKEFLTELVKNNIVKVILSTIDISSHGIEVKNVFVSDVQVYNKEKIENYNKLIGRINQLHVEIFYDWEEKGDEKHISRNGVTTSNEVTASEDMYRLHFIKYFMFLNFRSIFRKYTLSNNDLLNLSKNSMNYFLIPRRYEDIPIILNLHGHNYLNFSNLNRIIVNDFYFNLYHDSVQRSISIQLNLCANEKDGKKKHAYGKDNPGNGDKQKEEYRGKLAWDRREDYCSAGKTKSVGRGNLVSGYQFFRNTSSTDRLFIEERFFHMCANIAKTSMNIHKIYKYKILNESILLNCCVHVCNNVAYSANYFDFLYFYFMKNNKNFEFISEQVRYNFFHFYQMERKKYEKKYVKYNKESKMKVYFTNVMKIKKYFDEEYAYMYYNTYCNYTKLREKVREKLKMAYKEKYEMVHIENIKNFKNKIVTAVDEKMYIIIDKYEIKKGKQGKKKKKKFNNVYICVNEKKELILCSLLFFNSVFRDRKMYNYIKRKNKNLNYYHYLFNKREVCTYKIFTKEYTFPFDIYKNGETNKDEVKLEKKYMMQLYVNKIRMNEELSPKEEPLKKERTKISVDIDNILDNSYDEKLYTWKNKLYLYLRRMRNMKKELYLQYLRKRTDTIKKKKKHTQLSSYEMQQLGYHNDDEESATELEFFTKMRNGSMCERGYMTASLRSNLHNSGKIGVNLSLLGGKGVIRVTNNGKCKKKKILSLKMLKIVNMQNKKKNSGNRNIYANELDNINRILGNNCSTIMEEYFNMFFFLKNLHLINALKDYVNPYIKNTLWFYIISLYINRTYALNGEVFKSQPELLIIIFFICFYKGENDYIANYMSVLNIKEGFLKGIVSDIFAYRELLSFAQNRFKINIGVILNLKELDEIYDGLIKLKKKKFGQISKNAEAIFADLKLILRSSLSINWGEGINKIIFDFTDYMDKMSERSECDRDI